MGPTRAAAVLVSACVALLPLPAAGQSHDPGTVPRISQAAFKRLVAAHNVVIVDTRDADSYAAGHIPGAVLLPLDGLPSFPRQYDAVVATLKAAHRPIVAYCA